MRFYLEYINHLGRLQKKSARLVRQAHQPVRHAGFTITEVLLAGVMMLIAVLVSGIGVINLLRSNYRANADSEIRNNLNRTLEFVSDEVRRARIIVPTEGEIDPTNVPNWEKIKADKGARAVLAFRIPAPNNPIILLPDQIVYYTTGPENSLTGPRVLWRFGPNLDDNGNYITPEQIGTWIPSPVTDMLAAAPADQPNCPKDFNRIPANPSSADGFYTCVRQLGGQVILNANAQVEMTTLTAGERDKVDYAASTRVATRAICSKSDSICLIPPPDPTFNLGGNLGAKKIETIPVLTTAANVMAELIQGPDCSPCTVAASPDPNAQPTGVAIPSTLQVNAGEAVIINVNDLYNNRTVDPNTGKTIEAYTSKSSGSPISLNNNQVLLVFTTSTTPLNSYQVLLTITPR